MYTRQFITTEENANGVKYNPEFGMCHSILREKSPVDEFYFEECKGCDDELPSYSVCDPIVMLFNQERINNLGSMTAKEFIDSLIQKDSSLSDLRQKCSDEDLLQMCKSRYLQTPSEILAYCRWIKGNVDLFNSEVQKLVEETAAAEKVSAEKVSSSNVQPQISE